VLSHELKRSPNDPLLLWVGLVLEAMGAGGVL
jgi:hypothetical protein